MGNTKQKVCVIGLDGTPFSLLNSLAGEGILPNIDKLFKSGTAVPMTTALPEISSVAWTSFMTGVNPAKHSIFGFTDLIAGSYNLRFPNSLDVKSQTLWERLGQGNKRSVVINVPSTYPAAEINGTLVSGFVSPDFSKAVYPPSLISRLQESGYRIDIDLEKAFQSKDFLLEDANDALEKRLTTIGDLFNSEQWDLFVGVVTETDRLHHFLWAELEEDNNSRYKEGVLNCYKEIDNMIGEIYEGLDDETLFIILSDHGFCGVKKQVYLNQWLYKNDYLAFKKPEPALLMDIEGAKTKAFCMDPGRIYINTKSRFGEGIVDSVSYEPLRDELIAAISELRAPDGEPIANKVYRKEEIYHGPYINEAPDLLVLANPGWDLKGSVAGQDFLRNGPWSGMHTHDNAVFYINRNINTKDVNIIDLMPTILKYLEIDTGADIDGRQLL